jgi:hypothetical protein
MGERVSETSTHEKVAEFTFECNKVSDLVIETKNQAHSDTLEVVNYLWNFSQFFMPHLSANARLNLCG